MNTEMTEEQEKMAGYRLAKTLGLKPMSSSGKVNYETTYGPKTYIGLWRMIVEIVNTAT